MTDIIKDFLGDSYDEESQALDTNKAKEHAEEKKEKLILFYLVLLASGKVL